jgi:hypothetical protein
MPDLRKEVPHHHRHPLAACRIIVSLQSFFLTIVESLAGPSAGFSALASEAEHTRQRAELPDRATPGASLGAMESRAPLHRDDETFAMSDRAFHAALVPRSLAINLVSLRLCCRLSVVSTPAQNVFDSATVGRHQNCPPGDTIPYAVMSETLSNRWNLSVISDFRLSAWIVAKGR